MLNGLTQVDIILNNMPQSLSVIQQFFMYINLSSSLNSSPY